MSWVEETLKDNENLREAYMRLFMNEVNRWRAEGFCDIEVYHLLYGIHCENQIWPLFEYWCEIFLDWDDGIEVESG